MPKVGTIYHQSPKPPSSPDLTSGYLPTSQPASPACSLPLTPSRPPNPSAKTKEEKKTTLDHQNAGLSPSVVSGFERQSLLPQLRFTIGTIPFRPSARRFLQPHALEMEPFALALLR